MLESLAACFALLLSLSMFVHRPRQQLISKIEECYAVTRIRTWVIAATTQCTNHYTITAMKHNMLITERIAEKRTRISLMTGRMRGV